MIQQNDKIMKTFTNVFGTKIENKPFFQTCLNTWRVARFENNELFQVFESKGYKSYDECLKACLKKQPFN